MISNFTFYTPTKIVFGRDTVDQTGALAAEAGAKSVLVVYGSDRVKKSGLLDRVLKSLNDAGIKACSIGGVVPNPHLSLVYEGIELGKANGVDFLMGVGGGSVIDTAKAISYGLAEPEYDVWELYAHTRKAKKALPVGVVLTIAAAGSEMSNSSVITDEKTGMKRGCNFEIIRPKFAVMDPTLTQTLPDYQTMSGCVDMMMHTMERYFTNGSKMAITDALAEGLLRCVMEQTKILHADPENYDARAEVMWASSLAHNGLTGLGNSGDDFASHRLEHELGGMFDVTHGAGLAAIWGTWARYVMHDCLPRFVKFAIDVMGVEPGATDEETALRGIEAMENFYRSINMPTNLRELGVQPTEEQLRALAKGCEAAVGGKMGSAKVLYVEDMYNIYKAAM